MRFADLLTIFGLVAVVVGICLVHIPAGVITGGVLLTVVGEKASTGREAKR